MILSLACLKLGSISLGGKSLIECMKLYLIAIYIYMGGTFSLLSPVRVVVLLACFRKVFRMNL